MDLNKKARDIIEKIKYITIATVSPDGQPWNTPVYSAFDEDYNFYWASDQNGQHSRNIAVNNKVFLVIYDSTVKEGEGEGVYVLAKAYKLENSEEIEEGIRILYGRSGREFDLEQKALTYQGNKPRRVYKAVSEKFWMNGEGEINGEYIDTREEITLK